MPAIILVRPQMGENIGAAARAMANFGLKDLRLVAPRDGWPNPKAADTAAKALDILDDAKLYETAQKAVVGCGYVLATTARERAVSTPVLSPREAVAELRAREAKGQRCAILFGPERTGLENEEVALADAVVTIPVAEEYTSLNLAQAVVVMGYEWFIQTLSHRERVTSSSESGEGLSAVMPSPYPLPAGEGLIPAPREELLGLFGQLEEALDTVNFWRVPEKKESMWRHLRATLIRVGFTSQEIATWRGIFRALTGEKH